MKPLIVFPRMGLDGKLRTQEEVESAYVEGLEKEIKERLDIITPKSELERRCLDFLKRQIEFLLIAKPISLERIKKDTDRLGLFAREGDERAIEFRNEVLSAFNYDGYRKNGHFVSHAERLNVKTCCYCNINYTLLIEEKQARTMDKKALFQFDHFYDKAKYPHLSMSMYNLIPCCSTCNLMKPRSGDLPIYFNPFYSSILGLFKFKVKDPLELFLGVIHPEKIEVDCVPLTAEDISACNEWFHLSAKYSVHKDIVEEVFDKAKQYPYYAHFQNFEFLREGASYPLRLLLGVYPDEKDFGKRPMSKFITDIWEQACLFIATTGLD